MEEKKVRHGLSVSQCEELMARIKNACPEIRTDYDFGWHHASVKAIDLIREAMVK